MFVYILPKSLLSLWKSIHWFRFDIKLPIGIFVLYVSLIFQEFYKQAVKIDINIERDMAYALKVKEGPQVLFLRGNRILYREKGKNLYFLILSYIVL